MEDGDSEDSEDVDALLSEKEEEFEGILIHKI